MTAMSEIPAIPVQPNKWLDCNPINGKCSNRLHTGDKRIKSAGQCHLGRGWSMEAPICPVCKVEFPEHFGRLLNPVLVEKQDEVVKPTLTGAAGKVFFVIITKPKKEICPDCAATLLEGVNARGETPGVIALTSGATFTLLLPRKEAMSALREAEQKAMEDLDLRKQAVVDRMRLATRIGGIPFGGAEWRGEILFHQCVMATPATNLCLAATQAEAWEESKKMAGKRIGERIVVPVCKACASALDAAGAELVDFPIPRVPRPLPPAEVVVKAPREYIAPSTVRVERVTETDEERRRRNQMQFVAPVPGRSGQTSKASRRMSAAEAERRKELAKAKATAPTKGKKNKKEDEGGRKKR